MSRRSGGHGPSVRVRRRNRGGLVGRGLAFLTLALLSLALTTAAADDAAPLTLEEALRLAEAQNPELQAAQGRAKAQLERAESTGGLKLPRVSLGMGWSYTDNPSYVFSHKLTAGEFTQQDFAIDRLNSPSAIGHLTSALSVEAPIDLAGRVRDQAAAQSAGSRALSEAAREARLEIRLKVSDAYRRAVLAERSLEVNERALAVARAREDEMQLRVAEGGALHADLLRARARRRQREADLADRRGELAVVRAGLARAIGAAPGTAYRPTEAAAAPAPLTEELTAWRERALQARPALAASRERLQSLRLARHAEERAAWPELGVYAQLQDDRNSFSQGGQSATLGAALRWNLFDGTRKKRVAAAVSEEQAVEQEARAALDQVALEVEAAYRRAVAARERYAAAGGGAEEGREALRVVRERRQAGLATLTDELETETAALQAILMEVQAATEAALADAALRRAAGEI